MNEAYFSLLLIMASVIVYFTRMRAERAKASPPQVTARVEAKRTRHTKGLVHSDHKLRTAGTTWATGSLVDVESAREASKYVRRSLPALARRRTSQRKTKRSPKFVDRRTTDHMEIEEVDERGLLKIGSFKTFDDDDPLKGSQSAYTGSTGHQNVMPTQDTTEIRNVFRSTMIPDKRTVENTLVSLPDSGHSRRQQPYFVRNSSASSGQTDPLPEEVLEPLDSTFQFGHPLEDSQSRGTEPNVDYVEEDSQEYDSSSSQDDSKEADSSPYESCFDKL